MIENIIAFTLVGLLNIVEYFSSKHHWQEYPDGHLICSRCKANVNYIIDYGIHCKEIQLKDLLE